jgi:hypothetical protein
MTGRQLINVLFFFSLASTFSVLISGYVNAEVTAEKSNAGATVKIDGDLFTEYVIQSGSKPILWPIIGPTGKPMTRAYPMQSDTKETNDHPWHRSFWFTHGLVNGVDFWGEKPGNGTIKHREFVKLESGETGLIITKNDWIDAEERKICEDERTVRFGKEGDCRWIDFKLELKAVDKPLKLGDTKEGTFGIRVADSMNLKSKQGGHIINGNGELDGDTWGKAAQWVDYHGPVDGKVVGIAILNHPSSFGYPTYWHVRDYGLFAANPFGLHDFNKNEKNKEKGSHTIEVGHSTTFRYRVFFHLGDEKESKIAEKFLKYSKQTD